MRLITLTIMLILMGLILGYCIAQITMKTIPANKYECGMRDVRTGVCTQYDLKEGGK